MTLETPRLILRRWMESDAAELYLHAKNPHVGPAAGWPPHKNQEESLQIIRTVLSGAENYALVLKETELPVGCIELMKEGSACLHMTDTERELGYWLAEPYWGQGLMCEAVEVLLWHAFVYMGCSALWCGYLEGNSRSRRVQEKCGFLYSHSVENRPQSSGEKQTEHFSRLTREQWKALQRSSPDCPL